MTDFPRPIARERIAAFPRDRGSEDILDVSKHYQKGAGQRCLQKANGLRQTGERVQWPGQGDLGWNLRTDVFSMILVAITIALDDEEKKLSKRRPEKPPALNSSSREVDSWVEALRFDRRAGALGLHLCGFSKPLWLFFFFWPRINFQNQFSKPIFTMGFWKSTKNRPGTRPASSKNRSQNRGRNWPGTGGDFPVFKKQFSKTSS